MVLIIKKNKNRLRLMVHFRVLCVVFSTIAIPLCGMEKARALIGFLKKIPAVCLENTKAGRTSTRNSYLPGTHTLSALQSPIALAVAKRLGFIDDAFALVAPYLGSNSKTIKASLDNGINANSIVSLFTILYEDTPKECNNLSGIARPHLASSKLSLGFVSAFSALDFVQHSSYGEKTQNAIRSFGCDTMHAKWIYDKTPAWVYKGASFFGKAALSYVINSQVLQPGFNFAARKLKI